MRTAPIRLSDCGSLLVLDETPGNQYCISIEPGGPLLLHAGAFAGSAAARFTHPHLVATRKRVHEFKHYRRDGGKFWTARAGITHSFRIPRQAVLLLPEKGYSSIKAEINGVTVSVNVSGGTTNGGWCDRLSSTACIAIGHPLRDLQRFAEMALPGPHPPLEIPPLSPDEEARWNQLAAKATSALKTQLYTLIEAKRCPLLHLLPGYTLASGAAIELHRHWKNHRVQTVIVDANGQQYRVRLSQVEWYQTAQTNGIAA